MTTLDKETIKRLLEADWELAQAKALKRATVEARFLDNMGLPSPSPEELVSEARARIFDGSRKWDYERYPDLGTHLAWIVGSIASHERERYRRRNMTSLNEPDSEKLRAVEIDAGLSPWAPRMPNPEESAILHEQWTFMQRQFEELAEEDEDIEFVFICFQDGITKLREIAEVLEWEVRKVNNALKRIRRKLRSDPQPSSTMPRSSLPKEKKAFRRQQ